MDNATALRLKKQLAEFRAQIAYGIPTNADETGLRPPPACSNSWATARKAVPAA
jgi:hypothetical protein